ncbi:MAG: hypothetical protein HOW73_23715 [Polyangiaceae bacterium]|nr:hypothetical protein [Polyangiaceae bacterium]
MRYLYGVSTPFPYEFDFLQTLGAFMTSATRVVQLDAEAQQQAKDLASISQERIRGLDAVQGLHNQVIAFMGQVLPSAGTGPRGTQSDDVHPAALDYVRKIKDYSARIANDQRQQEKDTTEREGSQLLAENDRRAGDTRSALDLFFRTAVLPILSSRTSLKLLEGKDKDTARYEVGVVFRNMGDIVTSFLLSTANSALWGTPRKVADLTTGVDLMVGVKKSFFKGVVTPETVHLDEYVISRADVHDRGSEIALRKRVDQKDAYVFRITKSDKSISGEVERLDDPNGKALSPALDGQDLAKVDQLAQTIRTSLTELYNEREAVVRVEIEGKDVYKNRLAMHVVGRLIRAFSPIVEEIAARSPSQQELSLKLENENGKREELYLKRDDLLKKLAPLNADGRGVFAPLGLDDWVPTLTLHPSEVIEDEG